MISFPCLREPGWSFLQKISRWWTRCHHHSQGRSQRHSRAPPSSPSVSHPVSSGFFTLPPTGSSSSVCHPQMENFNKRATLRHLFGGLGRCGKGRETVTEVSLLPHHERLPEAPNPLLQKQCFFNRRKFPNGWFENWCDGVARLRPL